ncbi:MAG: hypothetical protein WCS09_18875 [Pseudomonadota bacterium]|jgi:hypothetical protein
MMTLEFLALTRAATRTMKYSGSSTTCVVPSRHAAARPLPMSPGPAHD